MGSNSRYTEEQIAASRRTSAGSKTREVHFYSVDQWSADGKNLEEVLARGRQISRLQQAPTRLL